MKAPAATANSAVFLFLANSRLSGGQEQQWGNPMTWRKLHSIRGVLLGVALALASLTGGARAQNAGPTYGWSFQLTPYLWLAGINGDVEGPHGLSASFDAGIGDVLSHLDGGLMLLGEARYRRWGILVDFDYARLSGTDGSFHPFWVNPRSRRGNISSPSTAPIGSSMPMLSSWTVSRASGSCPSTTI